MSHDARTTHTGEVTDVFAHRFVVRTVTGKILALGPKGAERMSLRQGDQVEMSGETKPSELKVHRIAKTGEQPVIIAHGKPRPDERDEPDPHRHHEHTEADPAPALRTVETNGFTVLGVPRRKPKHFEILGRDKAGDLVELHVELDGTLRKTKPVAEDEGKWKAEIAQSA
jgi:hypothetical protein